MSVALIADSHLGGPGGDGDLLVEQLRALPGQGCEHLVLMGDIFHVWVGSPRFETPEVRKVMPELKELRRRGIRVDYVEGNRDFFIQNSVYADAFDRIALETSFEVAAKRYLCVHGDGLNDQDWQYRFWRRLSKSPPVRFLVQHLPTALAQGAVRSTEEKLAQTNFKHRREVPRNAICAYGSRRLEKEGFDTLFLGHFHASHQFSVESGEIHCLDAWFNSKRVEWVRDS